MLPIANILGMNDWIIVLIVIGLLFGVKRLPEIGKSMAEGIHEFKKAARKAKEEDETEAAPKQDSAP